MQLSGEEWGDMRVSLSSTGQSVKDMVSCSGTRWLTCTFSLPPRTYMGFVLENGYKYKNIGFGQEFSKQ